MTTTATVLTNGSGIGPSAQQGLSTADALRLIKLGRNELVQADGRSIARIFLSQFKGAMVWLLVGATVISAFAGERIGAAAIALILVLNAVVGFLQEFRAEKAVLALKKMTAPRARVLRDGHVVEVAAAEIVTGDVLVLDAGDVVAADGRQALQNLWLLLVVVVSLALQLGIHHVPVIELTRLVRRALQVPSGSV